MLVHLLRVFILLPKEIQLFLCLMTEFTFIYASINLFDIPFQKQVLRQTMKVPYGRTSSYGEIASRIGRPAAYRAVGNAVGANPIPIVIPCHRIIASDGGIGGFSGGLSYKKKLLALEGVL